MTAAPGWYPDPSDPGIERWFDGAQWADHRRHPTPSAPAATAGLPPPPILTAPSSPPKRGGVSAARLALFATVFVVAASAGAGVVWLLDDDPSTGDSPTPTPTSDLADETSWTDAHTVACQTESSVIRVAITAARTANESNEALGYAPEDWDDYTNPDHLEFFQVTGSVATGTVSVAVAPGITTLPPGCEIPVI